MLLRTLSVAWDGATPNSARRWLLHAERDMDLRGFGDVDESGDSQTGATRSLFFGVQLTHKEIDAASKRMGVE